MKQAKEIPAKCPECNWEGYLVECLNKLPHAIILKPNVLNETIPICPKCCERVEW